MATPTRTPLSPAARSVVRVGGLALLLDTTFFSVLSPLLAGYASKRGIIRAAPNVWSVIREQRTMSSA